MKFQDEIQIKGEFEVKIIKNGNIIEVFTDKNLIVNLAKETLAKLIGGDGTGKSITKISFGTSGISPTPDDISIISAYTKNIDSHTYPALNKVTFNWTLGTNEANGKAIKEFGLICSDNTLFSRKTRGTIEKENDISLEGTWTIIF